MYNINEPFQLRKRCRHDEDVYFVHSKLPWQKTIIDLEHGTYLERTPQQWFYLFIFYAVFYIGLVLLWIICYMIFDGTIEYNQPKWLLKQPGFSFEPSLHTEEYDIKIEYHQAKEDEVSLYVNHIEMTLMKYGLVPKDTFGNCSSEEDFGYVIGKPCVFLKINRIVGFCVDCIERPNRLPMEAPQELYHFMSALSEDQRKGRLWVSCQSLPMLSLQYYPQRYFNATAIEIGEKVQHSASDEYIEHVGAGNAKFYNDSDFQRIIALQILNVQPNVKYKVMCFLWAKNIDRDIRGKMGRGLVRFNLRIMS